MTMEAGGQSSSESSDSSDSTSDSDSSDSGNYGRGSWWRGGGTMTGGGEGDIVHNYN
jgi:hypothetical protein